MDMRENNAVEVLRRELATGTPAGDKAISSAVILAERLDRLKRSSRLFEAVSFSPEVEAMLSEQLAAAAN
jgi:hypothetical protein